jgi:hypothetical protein
MYSKAIFLRHEFPQAFEALRRSYHADFAPTDPINALLVDGRT